MELQYEGGNEVAILKIDRVNKILKICSTRTGNKLVTAEWKNLFDKGKEEEQEKVTSKLNDKDFARAISITMQQHGYKLKDIKW